MPDDPNASAGVLSEEGQEIRFAPVASGTSAAASGPGVGVFVAPPDSGLLVGVRVGVEVGADDVGVAVAEGPPGAEVGVLVGGAVGAGVEVCVAGDVGDVGAAVDVLAGVFVGGGAPLSSNIPNGVVQYQP